MAAIKAIRGGLEDRLDTIDGLRIYQGGNFNPPCAVVSLATEGINYHETSQNGLTRLEFRVVVYVSMAYTRVARDLCDDFLDVTGDLSVKAAIEGDATLGGIVDDLIVDRGAQQDFVFQEAGTFQQYLGAEFFVTVLSS